MQPNHHPQPHPHNRVPKAFLRAFPKRCHTAVSIWRKTPFFWWVAQWLGGLGGLGGAMRSSGCAISANLMSVTVASAASVTGTLFAIVQQVFGGTQNGKALQYALVVKHTKYK